MSGIQKVVIVGGGSSGWMSAALLAKLTAGKYDITVVDSSDIGTIGVGEATVPAMKIYNDLIGLNEKEFIQATQGTFKLGIQFSNWGHIGNNYIHGFGETGRKLGWLNFYQYWLKQKSLGLASGLDSYRINNQMALHNKFVPAQNKLKNSPLSDIVHAYHLDAGLYGQYLKKFSIDHGVKHIDGKIIQVNQEPTTGFIQSLKLESSQMIDGDLFIDCSGMTGLLIEKTLNTGFEDWGHWLPCDSALAIPTERTEPLLPYTRSIAHESGWQWRIPLQHRTGNGHVYSSQFIDDEHAKTCLLNNLDGKILADPKLIKFKTGRRKLSWNKNCVAIGLSAGFLEPLESTSLYLVQSSITRLVNFFPDKNFHQQNIDTFNQQTNIEIDSIRDFIIAHYKMSDRVDSKFWRYCQSMEVPDTLTNKLELFKANGRVTQGNDEIFREEAWAQMLIGQGVIPNNYDPMVDVESAQNVKEFVSHIESVVKDCHKGLPEHAEFIRKQCLA